MHDKTLGLVEKSRKTCHAWGWHVALLWSVARFPRPFVRLEMFPILPYPTRDYLKGRNHRSSCHAKLKMTAFCPPQPIRGEDKFNACITLASVRPRGLYRLDSKVLQIHIKKRKSNLVFEPTRPMTKGRERRGRRRKISLMLWFGALWGQQVLSFGS